MANSERSTPELTGLLWSPLLDEHLAEVTRINAELQAYPWNLKHWQSSQLPNYRNWVILAHNSHQAHAAASPRHSLRDVHSVEILDVPPSTPVRSSVENPTLTAPRKTLATENGKNSGPDPHPVAYISFMLAHDTAELMNIGVSPDYQSQGIGRAMLAGGISLLPELVVKIYLEVRQSNRTARRLYESMGFRVLAKRANYYPVDDETREAAVVYSLEHDGLPVKDIDFYQDSGKLAVVERDILMGKGEAK